MLNITCHYRQVGLDNVRMFVLKIYSIFVLENEQKRNVNDIASDSYSTNSSEFDTTSCKKLQTVDEYVITKVKGKKAKKNKSRTDVKPLNSQNSNINGSYIENIDISDSSDADSDDCTIENLTQTEDTDAVMFESPDPFQRNTITSNKFEIEHSLNNSDHETDSIANSSFMEDENDLEITNDSPKNVEYSYNEGYEEEISLLEEIKVVDVDEKRLVVLQKNSVVYFTGFATVRVLCGTIEILGSILSENSLPVEVYSPRGTSLLYIAVPEVAERFPTNLEKLMQLNIQNSEKDAIFTSVNEGAAAILLENNVKLNVPHLEKHIPQQIFPKEQNGFCFTFLQDISGWNSIEISPRWEELSRNIFQDSRVILCGGKGVGKSTLLRYLINSLLMRFEKVNVIDLDPGQPEFTVPGCVSMCVVDKGIYGPSFAHILKPDR